MELGLIYDSCGGAIGGQVEKNINIIDFFEKSGDKVYRCDVSGLGRRKYFSLCSLLHSCCKRNRTIIVILDSNNYYYIVPILVFLKNIYKNKLFFLTIGSETANYIKSMPRTVKASKTLDYIFTETNKCKADFEKLGITQVGILPTCRQFAGRKAYGLSVEKGETIQLCYFSRVTEDKGIFTIIDTIDAINKEYGRKCFELHIYGSLDKTIEVKFGEYVDRCKGFVDYKGFIEYDNLYETLEKYYAFMFISTHIGEGFPTAIIESYNAGLPVIATNWISLPDIVIDGKTGHIIDYPYEENLQKLLRQIIEKPENMLSMRQKCIEEAKKYDNDVVLSKLRDFIIDNIND